MFQTYFLKKNLIMFLEGAGHDALFFSWTTGSKNQSDILITSTGALTDIEFFFEKLISLSTKYNSKIMIASAGIGALDILTASSYGKLNEVNITVRKNTEVSWHNCREKNLI